MIILVLITKPQKSSGNHNFSGNFCYNLVNLSISIKCKVLRPFRPRPARIDKSSFQKMRLDGALLLLAISQFIINLMHSFMVNKTGKPFYHWLTWVKWLRMQGHRLPATLEVTSSNPSPGKIYNYNLNNKKGIPKS